MTDLERRCLCLIRVNGPVRWRQVQADLDDYGPGKVREALKYLVLSGLAKEVKTGCLGLLDVTPKGRRRFDRLMKRGLAPEERPIEKIRRMHGR